MKRYRQGKGYDGPLELLTYRSGTLMESTQTKQIIAMPNIVDERLSMRLQTVYFIPPKEPNQMYLLSRNLVKCPHTNRWSDDKVAVTRRLFQRFAAPETILGGRQEHIMSCQGRLCPTEFQFSLQRFEGQWVVFFSTKWQDLGTELSPLHSEWLTIHLESDSRNSVQTKTSRLFLLWSTSKAESCSERATQGWRNEWEPIFHFLGGGWMGSGIPARGATWEWAYTSSELQ